MKLPFTGNIRVCLSISWQRVRLSILVFVSALGAANAQSLPGSGNSLTFNGFSNYVSGGTSNRGMTQRVTVEAWIKTRSTAYQWIVSKYLNSNFEEKDFHLYTTGGTAGFNGRNGSGVYMSSGFSTTRVDDGRWHHIAGVCNVSTWQIYVDGILENSASYSTFQSDLTTTTALAIGCYDVQSGQFFDGDIDEVRMWRTARTQAEIQASVCQKFATAPADLVAYYRFDQSSGGAVADNGSVPINGSLINFPTGNPWHLSGAPLGDASTALYQNTWPAGTRLRLATAAGDSAIVGTISALIRGVHLYAVNSAPAIVPPGAAGPGYVGVFTAGPAPATSSYALRLRPATGPGCRNAFVRAANDQAWTLPPAPPTTATSLLLPAALYRSEHLLNAALAPAITGDSVLCTGARTTLTVSVASPGTYLWNTGATTAGLGNVGPGTYTVTVTTATGCSGTARRTVRVAPVPTLAITGDSVLCAGASTVLTAAAGGATAYRWSTGATTATLTVSQPGSYTVTATYGAGCATTARRQVRLNLATAAPAFGLGADTTLCDGDQVVLRGPAGPGLRYQWSDGSTNQQLAVQTAGRYTLRVLAGCGEQTAARTVALRSCLVVPNVVTANADGRNDRFAIQALRGEGWSLDVYNRWGRAVYQTANYHNDWGAGAAAGMYYVLLRRPATGFQYKGWVEVLR